MRLSIPALSLAAIVAPGLPAQPPRVDVVVSVRNARIEAPATAAPGWPRVRVDEDGDTGEVIVHLTPGRYLIGCVRRGADGHRHLHGTEWKTLVVRQGTSARGRAKPPSARHVVRMVDFAFTGEDRWTAGPQLLKVENTGHQDHQLRIVKLRPGATMKAWIDAPNPGAFAVPVAGMARLGAGETSYLSLNLPPGSYVAHCLVTDPATGRQHIQLGMYRLIRVP